MRFLNPVMLLGLLAVLVPIIVHLINRRQAARVPFPAMVFLLRSQEQTARHLKLRQWLLLAARIGVLLLIPLAMAQPYALCGESGVTADERLPAAVVVVVDDSGSMSWREGGGRTLYDQAAERATQLVRELRSWDRVAVIFASDEPLVAGAGLADDRAATLRALRGHEPRYGSAGLAAALQEARLLLLEADQPVRRVVVVGDDTRRAWDLRELERVSLDGLAHVERVSVHPRVYAGRALPNLAVRDIAWAEAGSEPGMVEITAEIGSHGLEQPTQVTVELLERDSVVATTRIPVEPEGGGLAVFTHVLEGDGVHEITVRIDEQTGLTSDNARHLALQQRRSVNVLLVNGAPNAVAYLDELFYLERAINASPEERRDVRASTVGIEGLARAELDAWDVVVLANVAHVPGEQAAQLLAFVEQGGGLWLTPGEQLDPARWNAALGALLPRRIRDVVRLCEPDDPDANIKATRLSVFDPSHAIFRPFVLPGGESLENSRVYSYALLDPGADDSTRTLASYADGGPAILERAVGRGRVLLWTTTIDLDWTDLPIRTAYLPLVSRTLRYLARRAGESRIALTVGERNRIALEGLGAEQLIYTGPDGSRHVMGVEDDVARFVPPVVGIYTASLVVRGAERPAPELSVAANHPVAESDTTPAPPDELAAWLRGAGAGSGGAIADVPENRTRTWPVLLFIALVLVYLESLLALRRRLWSRLADLFRTTAPSDRPAP